jgi:hypothetical protein
MIPKELPRLMNKLLLPVALIATLLPCSTSRADEPRTDFLFGICVPDCVKKRCCDDYCSKSIPKTPCAKMSCCDNYCAKPVPCPKCIKKSCCDDYCRKPLPCAKCPPGGADKLKCSASMCTGHK